jgi:hypothetical protein
MTGLRIACVCVLYLLVNHRAGERDFSGPICLPDRLLYRVEGYEKMSDSTQKTIREISKYFY